VGKHVPAERFNGAKAQDAVFFSDNVDLAEFRAKISSENLAAVF